MTWRFLPVLDPLVAAMVSRDLDARLTTREAAAVMDWIKSTLPFHVMRSGSGIQLLILILIMMVIIMVTVSFSGTTRTTRSLSWEECGEAGGTPGRQ